MVFFITIGEVIGLTVLLFYFFLFIGMMIDDHKREERFRRAKRENAK